jgi:hypothetical protein
MSDEDDLEPTNASERLALILKLANEFIDNIQGNMSRVIEGHDNFRPCKCPFCAFRDAVGSYDSIKDVPRLYVTMGDYLKLKNSIGKKG